MTEPEAHRGLDPRGLAAIAALEPILRESGLLGRVVACAASLAAAP